MDDLRFENVWELIIALCAGSALSFWSVFFPVLTLGFMAFFLLSKHSFPCSLRSLGFGGCSGLDFFLGGVRSLSHFLRFWRLVCGFCACFLRCFFPVLTLGFMAFFLAFRTLFPLLAPLAWFRHVLRTWFFVLEGFSARFARFHIFCCSDT